MTGIAPRIVELRYEDETLARLELPGGRMEVLRGIGSGLCADATGRIWAVGDRGPNLKVRLAVERYGLAALARHAGLEGAKVMPCPDIGPAISELAVEGDRVAILRSFPIRDRDGRPLSGFPTPGGEHSVAEPAIAFDGEAIPPDPSGADSEGIAPAADGGFWIGDEYGPSLLRVAADGEVIVRWVPEGCEALFAGARYPVTGALPAIAARRRLNRGFEAIAVSADGESILLAFQSPLSHPDEEAHRSGRHVRIWRLDAETGAVGAEWLYPLDPPEAFRRDTALGPIERSDVKVSELVVIGADRLLVLERASATTKFYAVELATGLANDPAHLDPSTRPTVEELSAGDAFPLPVLEKRLVLDGDAAPELGPDLEGIALLPDGSLLIVNDNDFGVEGVRTRFWRVEGLSLKPGTPDAVG